jgi:hypothetical protein
MGWGMRPAGVLHRYGRRVLTGAWLGLLVFACANVLLLCTVGVYDRWVGPIHLVSHGLFKPLLILNGCLLASLVLSRRLAPAQENGSEGWRLLSGIWITAALVALVVSVLYSQSFGIDFWYHDWTHEHVSAGLRSLDSLGRLFVNKQTDGFYRPLPFVSLWIDYHIFRGAYWGYHLHSILLHFLNSLLVFVLGRTVRLPVTQARWAAVLYAGAAVNVEPVLWPAARFDLYATAFTLGAIISAMLYLQQARSSRRIWLLMLTAGSLACGLLSKETAYCTALLLGMLILGRRAWAPGLELDRRRLLCVGAAVVAVTAAMLSIRIILYHGFGGYPEVAGGSAQFTMSARTLWTLPMRVLLLPLFGVNTSTFPSGPESALVVAACSAYALWAFAFALLLWRGRVGAELIWLAAALLGALPTLNIIGWIGPSMLHSRYLYLPSVWFFFWVATQAVRGRWAKMLLAVLVVVNSVGVVCNLRIQRWALAETSAFAARVRHDVEQRKGVTQVVLAGVPEWANGVFFFKSELIHKVQLAAPNLKVIPAAGTSGAALGRCAGCLVYQWDDVRSDLIPLGGR